MKTLQEIVNNLINENIFPSGRKGHTKMGDIWGLPIYVRTYMLHLLIC